MEESFCRLGIFIRPRLQFLVCSVYFMGIYHPGYISFYFSICQSYDQFTISHHDLFEIFNIFLIIMIFIARPTCKISHNFGVRISVCGGPHRKPCGVTYNIIFLSPFPVLLFLFPYCWLESMGQVFMSQNLCFNWPNMLQYAWGMFVVCILSSVTWTAWDRIHEGDLDFIFCVIVGLDMSWLSHSAKITVSKQPKYTEAVTSK